MKNILFLLFLLLFAAPVQGREYAGFLWWEQGNAATENQRGMQKGMQRGTHGHSPNMSGHAGKAPQMRPGQAPDRHASSGPPHGMPQRSEGESSRPQMGGGDVKGGNEKPRDTTASKMPDRAAMMAMMKKPKTMELHFGTFPEGNNDGKTPGLRLSPEKMAAWIRTPEGDILPARLSEQNGRITTTCPPPSEEGGQAASGLYVVGVSYDAGVMDYDGDGKLERVHFYANGFLSVFSMEGKKGENQGAFFHDPDRLALEIGPTGKEAGRGGAIVVTQKAFSENELLATFRGKPLPGAEAFIMTSDGWTNQLRTDSEGVLHVVPVAKKGSGTGMSMMRSASSQSLYTVIYKTPVAGEYEGVAYDSEYYCASVLLDVRTPAPEWTSKSKGFILIAVSCIGFLVLAVFFAVYRRHRRAKQLMIEFDHRTVPTEEQP